MSSEVDPVTQWGLWEDRESLDMLIVPLLGKWKEGASGVAKVLAQKTPEKYGAITAEDVQRILGWLEEHKSKTYVQWLKVYQNNPLGANNKQIAEIRGDIARYFTMATRAEQVR